MTQVKVEEVRAKTVEEIKAMLGDMPSDTIAMLRKAEDAQEQPRAGVIDAITAEMNGRREEAEAAIALARQTAERAGIKLASGEEVEVLEARVSDAEEKAAKAKAKAEPPRKGQAKLRKLAVDAKADAVPAAIAFADRTGKTSRHLPDLEFRTAQFQVSRGDRATYTLQADIEFPGATTPVEVAQVFLLNDKGKAFAVCRFVAPLTIGGGGEVRLPAGYLTFA